MEEQRERERSIAYHVLCRGERKSERWRKWYVLREIGKKWSQGFIKVRVCF